MPSDSAERDAYEYDQRHPPLVHKTIHLPDKHIDKEPR